MDKVMGILIGVVVLLMLSLSVITVFQGSIDNFVQGSDDVEESGCNYQMNQVGPKGNGELINTECESDYEEASKEYEAAEEYGIIAESE